MQMKASVVPLALTRDFEATIESQKYEVPCLQRDLQTTQDSLFQGCFVDESVATSTSSVSRIPEPATSHPPQAGGNPELFLQRGRAMPKAASNLAAAPSTPPASISKALVWQCTILL